MKKIIALLVLVAILCCSCQSYEKTKTNRENTTSSQNKTPIKDLPSNKENVSSEAEIIIPKPPISNELNQLFGQGLEVYRWFHFSIMGDGEGKPVIKGERTYYPVNDNRFPTYESWYQYITSIFSKEIIDKYTANKLYENINGKLYAVMADSGGNITYISHKYELASGTENKVELKIIGTYNDWNGGKDYDKEYKTVFEKVNGKWIITQFEYWA